MSKIKTLIRKIKYSLKHDFFSIENVVLLLAIILCFYWTMQSINAMSRNWDLSERLSTEKKQLELLSVEVEASELENQYFQTKEYQEILSRKHLDKMLPGEKMVVMPDNTENAKAKHQKNTDSVNDKENRSNFEKWMAFLFPKY